MRTNHRTAALAVVVLAVAGCRTTAASGPAAPDDIVADEPRVAPTASARRPARVTAYSGREESGLTDEEQALLDDHCKHGAPTVDAAAGPTRLVVRRGYALLHGSRDKIPLWVCEHVEAHELGAGERPSGWRADPLLPKGERAEDRDYRNSGFSRGHMAPNGDYGDVDLKKETFFLSNAVPQEQQNNGGIWSALEGRARAWARAHASGVWIVTGPLFWDPDEEDATTADGEIEYELIGPGGVAVPTHLYKLVIVEDDAGLRAQAFVFANQPYESPHDLAAGLVSIDWLEARTGIDFMPEGDVDDVEAAKPASVWP